MDKQLDVEILFFVIIGLANFRIWKRRRDFDKKKRLRGDRITSSERERKYWYNQLAAYPEMADVLDEGVVHIYKIISVLDSELNGEKIEEYIAANNIQGLKKMWGTLPRDFEQVDYPILNIFLFKTDLKTYMVILSEESGIDRSTVSKIISNNFYTKDDFETRSLVYPI